ncbi:hypothetical protein GN244_ATG02929 [Phytophthora infestans]|nr:hypothetical protein GN244_ATG02929 [Phytophthora infestans]
MSQNGSSLPTCGRTLRRCARSERYNTHRLAAITEARGNQSEMSENSAPGPLGQRSRSEGVIHTTQGVRFEDKCRKYQSRLDNLMVVAADPCSSESNAKLAQKALRYRNKTRSGDARPAKQLYQREIAAPIY